MDATANITPLTHCSAHGLPLRGLCKKCVMPVCEKCQCSDKGHITTSLNILVATEFPARPDPSQAHTLAAAARRRMYAKRVAAVAAQKKICLAEKLVKKTIKIIKEKLRKRASLEEQKRTANPADKALCYWIKREWKITGRLLKMYNKQLDCRRIDVEHRRSAAAKAQDTLARFKFVSTLERFPHSAAGLATAALVAQTCRIEAAYSNRSLNIMELAELADAHMHVEAAIVTRFEAQLTYTNDPQNDGFTACLAAARACAAMLRAVTRLDARVPLTPEADACAREAAWVLGVALAPPRKSDLITSEDVVLSANLARTRIKKERAIMGEVQLKLDSLLDAWPPDEKRTNEAYALHADISLRILTLLSSFARSACTTVARTMFGGFSRKSCVTFEAERTARARAEEHFLSTVYAAADHMGKMQARVNALATVAALEGVPADTHRQCLVWDVLDVSCSPAFSVCAFNAFKGARIMPEVQAACAAELQKVGPLHVAVGEVLDWLPKVNTLDRSAASLSACGVLCVGTLIGSKELIVAHLPSRRIARVKCATEYAHGFVYKGELFVAEHGRASLEFISMPDLFANYQRRTQFKRMPLAARWGAYPRLDTAPVGVVVVANASNPTQHLVVDLAARTSHLVNVGQELPFLGGFAGIAVPGAAWAATGADKDSPMLAVAPDGTTQQIVDKMHIYNTVLVSASEPANLACAAVYDGRGRFSIGNKKWKLEKPVNPRFQLLVRMYRDVFLLWDTNTDVWITVRIVVP